MLALDSTAATITATLNAASTPGVSFAAAWADETSTAHTPGSALTTVTSGAATTVVAAPGASTVRVLTALFAYNNDITPRTITLEVLRSGTPTTVAVATVPPGSSIDLLAFSTTPSAAADAYAGMFGFDTIYTSYTTEVNKFYEISGSAGTGTVTLPAAPANGSRVGIMLNPGSTYAYSVRLVAGAGDSLLISSIVLLAGNCVVLVYYSGSWYPLLEAFDMAPVSYTYNCLSAVTTAPSTGGSSQWSTYWREGKFFWFRYRLSHTSAGTAGSGNYLIVPYIFQYTTPFLGGTTSSSTTVLYGGVCGSGTLNTSSATPDLWQVTPVLYTNTKSFRILLDYGAAGSAVYWGSTALPLSGTFLELDFTARCYLG